MIRDILIDSHAHLNFSAFKDDVDEVVKRTLDNNIWMINVGSQYSTSRRAVEITQKYDKGVYAAIGLHPMHLEERKVDHSEVDFQAIFKTRAEEFDYEKYKELASLGGGKVIAIGEVGLDYYYKPKTKKKLEEFKAKQKESFLNQLNLAKELNLPVIFHCRMAHDDLIEVLKSEIRISLDSKRTPRKVAFEINSKFQIQNPKLRGVIHCFTGNEEQANKYLEMGFYFGFNGLIFKKIEGAPDWQEIVKKLPIEKILIETDAPYLTPPQKEGQRNEPLYVKYVVQKIAELKKTTFEEITKITTQNAKELFRI